MSKYPYETAPKWTWGIEIRTNIRPRPKSQKLCIWADLVSTTTHIKFQSYRKLDYGCMTLKFIITKNDLILSAIDIEIKITTGDKPG